MTPEDLRRLVAAGETLAVEFKGEEREPLSDNALVEAVVCLANRPDGVPGWLLVGIEDDGRITGTRHRHGSQTDPHRVHALVANRTRYTVRLVLSKYGYKVVTRARKTKGLQLCRL